MKKVFLGFMMFAVMGFVSTASAVVIPVLSIGYWTEHKYGQKSLEEKCLNLGGKLLAQIYGRSEASAYEDYSYVGTCLIGEKPKDQDFVYVPVLHIEPGYNYQQAPKGLNQACVDVGGELVSFITEGHGGQDSRETAAGVCKVKISGQ